MKNKKGFTLVEMIAVLVILTILFVISFPTVLGVLSKANTKITSAQTLLIKDATKDYINEDADNYPQNIGDKYCINLIDLVEKDLITEKQLEDVDLSQFVNVDIKDNDIDINVSDKCLMLINDVVFSLKGEEEVIIETGNTWTDPGFTAMNKDFIDISSYVGIKYYNSALTELASIDTQQAGIYIIEYKLEYEDTEIIKERIVNVTLGNNPTITHPGESDIDITLKTFDILENVTAKDSNNENLQIYARSNITLGVLGKYFVEYTAKDKNGNTTKSLRTINIKKIGYSEELLNGASPVLDDGMIPVRIENDGTVKKADFYGQWYNYGNKEWANVVLVTESTRNKYQNISPGTVIAKSDILGYLVWIPRYKYSLPTGSGPRPFNIIFENKRTSKSSGTAIDNNYLTHPAFTFGNEEINGMWVSKFQTTGTNEKATILPNETSITGNLISINFNIARNFQSSIYGITSDSHHIKSSEWGGVAYLSHSNYGLTSEMSLNNNSQMITGCGAAQGDYSLTSSCTTAFGSSTSYFQSTTGNITGIFDMAGGAWEMVMGVYNNSISESGFTTMPEKKYYDNFTSTSLTTGCNGSKCNGYAFYETSGWYGDYAQSITSATPWYNRSGYYGNGSSGGMFVTSQSKGIGYSISSFRISISPTK